MKRYIKFLPVCVLMAATACTESDKAPEQAGNEITFICSYDDTRATDTSFENNDRVGIYMTDAGTRLQPGGNRLNNELFSLNGSVWKSDRAVYWDNGTYDVYAYYPYAPRVNDTEDYAFSVATDQSTYAGYTASDFLWASRAGVTASASAVRLQFSHRMSKAVIRLEKGADFTGEIPADCQVYIHNTVTDASVDLSTGGISKDSYAGAKTIRALKKSNTEYQAIVVPQNIEYRRPLVEIVSGGVSYLMEGKLSFKQGYSHTLVVTLAKNPEQTKIEIGGTIGGWD